MSVSSAGYAAVVPAVVLGVICYLVHAWIAVEAWNLYREERRDNVAGWAVTRRMAAITTLLWPFAPLAVLVALGYGVWQLAKIARRPA